MSNVEVMYSIILNYKRQSAAIPSFDIRHSTLDILRFAVPARSSFIQGFRVTFILLTSNTFQPLISNTVKDYKCFTFKIRLFIQMTRNLFNFHSSIFIFLVVGIDDFHGELRLITGGIWGKCYDLDGDNAVRAKTRASKM